jgi:hypothetical protein
MSKVVEAYQSVLADGGVDRSTVARGAFSDMVSQAVADAPEAEFAAAVPVVRQCLRSKSPEIRRQGLVLLVVYNSRPDSAQLIEPFIDDLIAILNDPAPGMKGNAASVLGGARPTPSDKSVLALAGHLNDKDNGPEEFRVVARALLSARPADVSIVRAVLAGLSGYSSDGLDGQVIQSFGLLRITCDEAPPSPQ